VLPKANPGYGSRAEHSAVAVHESPASAQRPLVVLLAAASLPSESASDPGTLRADEPWRRRLDATLVVDDARHVTRACVTPRARHACCGATTHAMSRRVMSRRVACEHSTTPMKTACAARARVAASAGSAGIAVRRAPRRGPWEARRQGLRQSGFGSRRETRKPMLFWLGQILSDVWGPFRLLQSYLFLTGFGAAAVTLATWKLLPWLWDGLPRDRGRQYAVGAAGSIGKPVAAGVIFVPLFIASVLVFAPWSARLLEALACIGAATIVGYIDDRTPGGLSEYTLAAVDLVLAIAGAAIVCQLEAVTLWLPFVASPIELGPLVLIPAGAVLIWLSINATNCSDGVDGLSGSLCALALSALGIILYGVVGHKEISSYLLVPHYAAAPAWAFLAFLMVGALAGYLWHNAPPSAVLMGDAGSRPLGLLVGLLVLASGNPFLIFVVAGVVLANGATGLLKVALLRFFHIGIFRNVRYPLHDHVRQKYGWSNTQVLVRFMLLQAVALPILLILLMKVR
jgi:phospho-N-acetylmuramoyl-pentapeptide-transferase